MLWCDAAEPPQTHADGSTDGCSLRNVAEPISAPKSSRLSSTELPHNGADVSAGSCASSPVVRPTMHHFGLKTTNLDAMVDWYAKVLGMEENHRSPSRAQASTESGWRTAWVSNDQANHRIAIMALPGLADDVQRSRHRGLHHIAFEFPTLDDLLATFRRLKLLGIEPVRAADHGATISFYYEDPDGNSIELLVDNFGDGRLSSEFMRMSAAFASNPMGADVDPEQILAARAAGTSVAEIHERAYAGEYCSASGFFRHYLASAANRNGGR